MEPEFLGLLAILTSLAGVASVLLKSIRKIKFDVVYKIITIIAGLLGLALAFFSFPEIKNDIIDGLSDFLIISVAFAQDESVVDNKTLLTRIVYIIFIAIVITFLVCLGTILFCIDNDENKRKLELADGLLKMIIGFFIGTATSFMNQALGV